LDLGVSHQTLFGLIFPSLAILPGLLPIAVVALYQWRRRRVRTLIAYMLSIVCSVAFDSISLGANEYIRLLFVSVLVKLTMVGVCYFLLFCVLRSEDSTPFSTDFESDDLDHVQSYIRILSIMPVWGPLFAILLKNRIGKRH